MPFFNPQQIFIVRKVLPKIKSYDYWISKTKDGVIIDKILFLRREFALKNEFILMDPIFIYYNNLKFSENKQFTLEFSNKDLLQGIIFLKNRDYFLMSMSCFMEVENKISKLKQYPAIKKISGLANRIIKNGVDHGYDSPEIEISYGGKTYEMDILKFNRSKSVNIFEFLDHYLKKKDLLLFTRFTKNCLIM